MSLVGNIHTDICVKTEVTFIKIIQTFINKIGIKNYYVMAKRSMSYHVLSAEPFYIIAFNYIRSEM